MSVRDISALPDTWVSFSCFGGVRVSLQSSVVDRLEEEERQALVRLDKKELQFIADRLGAGAVASIMDKLDTRESALIVDNMERHEQFARISKERLLAIIGKLDARDLRSIVNKLNGGHRITTDLADEAQVTLTHARSLQIFTWIRWESDFLSHLTMPFFAVPLSLALVGAAWAIPAVNIVMIVARTLALVGAGTIASFAIQQAASGNFSRISRAFGEQGKLARQYIQRLERQNPLQRA